MRRIMNITVLCAMVIICATAAAQELKYYDAKQFKLLGKPIEDSASERYYTRLPDSIQGKLERPYLFNLGTNTAGLAVRFATNSEAIGAKWTSQYENFMTHQTPTGTRGLDLYVLADDGFTWEFVNSGRPTLGSKTTTATIIKNMQPKMREYMLFLSLYDGIDSLAIGVDSNAVIVAPRVDLPKTQNPIVMYGTSLLQGGCANRPGMAHTNILQRWLNTEIINLGFSGNGQLDLPVAHVIAAIKNPGLIVMDMVPNANVEQMDTLLERFYDIIRAAHPKVPMIFVEDPMFSHTRFDQRIKEEVVKKNICIKKHFENFKKRGEKNIYYLPCEDYTWTDYENTVDALHYTDRGFLRYSEVLMPLIKKYDKKLPKKQKKYESQSMGPTKQTQLMMEPSFQRQSTQIVPGSSPSRDVIIVR